MGAQHHGQIVNLSLFIELLNPHAPHRISVRITVEQLGRDYWSIGGRALHFMGFVEL
jgi:hypothetical protein